jgi:uncharacterized membrane protein
VVYPGMTRRARGLGSTFMRPLRWWRELPADHKEVYVLVSPAAAFCAYLFLVLSGLSAAESWGLTAFLLACVPAFVLYLWRIFLYRDSTSSPKNAKEASAHERGGRH